MSGGKNSFEDLKKEGERLLKENELSETKVAFIKKHLRMLEVVEEIEKATERIEERLKSKTKKGG